jgi:hypothetical protein
MAFQDAPIHPEPMRKINSGLGVSKTGAMTLQVETGSVKDYQIGVTYMLASAQSHTFTSDATYAKRCFLGLINNGVTTDIWADEYLLDGLEQPADPPTGYTLIQALAWFDMDAGETDLDNATIYRRTWA